MQENGKWRQQSTPGTEWENIYDLRKRRSSPAVLIEKKNSIKFPSMLKLKILAYKDKTFKEEKQEPKPGDICNP